MSPARQRLLEDRALRDAARQVMTRTVEQVKADVASQGLAARVLDAGGTYARVAGEGAMDLAREHRKALSAGVAVLGAGLAAWLLRDRLADLADDLLGRTPDDLADEQ